jgi:hypothetical protein
MQWSCNDSYDTTDRATGMTDCTTDGIGFQRLGRREVHVDFKGGRLTSDAGLLLLRQVDGRIGLIDAINAAIPDPRDPEAITHPQRDLLAQRIFALAAGYEDLNDHQTLRDDPAMQAAAGRVPDGQEPLASPPTLCRLENRVSRQTNVAISKALVEQYIACHATPPEQIILDFDATDDPIHGSQEGRFFHGYYGNYCFLPLYVFAGDELLVAYLRPSNIDAARHSRAILKLLVTRLRRAWPDVKIIVRGDGGFCRWRMMRGCDRRGIKYLFGLSTNARLQAMAEPWMQEAEQRFAETGEKQRRFYELGYAAESWDRLRRVIFKAERLEQGPNLRSVVTNMDGDPQPLYDDVYCQRGEMENRIKEQQLGLFADRTSCHDFQANQFRLLLSAAAYVLFQALRRQALAGTELAAGQVTTIRTKLLKIAARIVVSARRVVFHFAGGCPYQDLLRRIADRLMLAPVLHTG